MNPNYKVRIKGKSFPVFRSPVTDKQIQELMLSGKTKVFFIHDNKSGKIKKYDFSNKLPQNKKIDLNIGYDTILKACFTAIMGFYVYKAVTYKPLNNWKAKNDEWLKKYNEKLRSEKVVKSPGVSTASESGANISESPNGWVIEELA